MVLNPSTLDPRLVISPFAQRPAVPQIGLCALGEATHSQWLEDGSSCDQGMVDHVAVTGFRTLSSS